jgi:predicted naringenin-chalcone synthase
LHHQYGWNADRIVANSLFADGAGAVIALSGQPERSSDYRVMASGSTVIADSEDAMCWRIADHGFEMTLSARVPELISQHLRPWLEDWLAQQELDLASVGSWAVHPGGPRILSAFEEATGIDPKALEISQQVLTAHGNMSSPTILFILDQLRRTDVRRPCVALAFGPGLTIEAALLN